DVLVIPGGMPGTKYMGEHELVKKAIKELYDSNRFVCAICAAPTILGKGGYLEGKNACVYPGNEDKLIGAKVNFDPVTRDGNIITSRGLGTAISFALEIISAVQGSEKAAEMAAKIVFNA
ncbi:MAG: DJ-1/PfpI family protein, partial [Lachnospiraceae bacterium]|nr:DJ-1/PfpI family protein [Lachnospiraceae bacterium]